MKRILLALQFWHGDAEAAWSLCALMRDLCPAEKYEGVDLLIVARHDAYFDMPAIVFAAARFTQVLTYRCVRKGEGWPQGPNVVAAETWNYFLHQQRVGRWNYDAIFLIEPDGLPLSRDWLERIVAEWRACDRPILGYFGENTGTPDHVNGNCLLAPRFGEIHPRFPNCPPGWSWDRFWRHEMLQHARASRTIWNDYQLGTERNPFTGIEQLMRLRESIAFRGEPFVPSYLHGVKCWREAHASVREFVLGKVCR